jgi:IS605 OrfB family transposase
MKITLRAVLVNLSEEKKDIIHNMMTIFCTAIRYSFKRLIEGNKTGNLEKDISHKYNLNIRQAKDAVESARQTIVAQKELLKINHESAEKKVKSIKKILEKNDLSDKKRRALESKLAKRERRLKYFKGFIENDTIPPVIFGTRTMFLKRCKGLITHDEWISYRNNRMYSRGDKTKNGNPNLRVVLKDNMSFLEISTLEKTSTNRAVKIQVPLYIPQKLSKKSGKMNGINYREFFLRHLQTKEAYQVELIKKNDKYYCHITFEFPKSEVIYTGHSGIIGIDTNPDGFALTMIDNKGNYKWHKYLKQHELQYARCNRRTNLCGELVKEVVETAKAYGTGLVIEDLKFRDDKDVHSKFSRIKHGFIYSILLSMLENACYKEGIEIVKVKPQFTRKIGLYKYCHQYGLDVHNGAAMVIARRSFKYKEKVPKLLKDKLVENIETFRSKNEWGRWSYINERLLNLERQVKNPGFWIVNRKELLGML